VLFRLICNKSNTVVQHVEQEQLTAPDHLSSSLAIYEVGVTLSVVFFVAFCRSLFALLFFLFWSLYCLSFLDLRNTSLVSSSVSYDHQARSTLSISKHIKVKCLEIYLEHLKYNPSHEKSVQTPYQDIIPIYVPLLYSYFHLQK
jgi:hypothetical protein